MDNGYYVYALCNPLKGITHDTFEFEPFYIGYGKNSRMLAHYKTACKIQKLDKTNNTYKNITLLKLIARSIEPVYVVLAHNITALEAKERECEWIAKLGRRDLGTGVLGNLTDGGDGISNISEETRRRMSAAHKGKMPANIEQLKNWRNGKTAEEISERNRRASLARNGGIRKPPRQLKYPGLTTSEIAVIRESKKTADQKKDICAKISNSRKGIDPHNKTILDGSLDYIKINNLFAAGVSAKNIFSLVYNHLSYDIVLGVIRRHNGLDTKVYRRQTQVAGAAIIDSYSTSAN